MPLAYQPLKGPPVEIKLVYSATRTEHIGNISIRSIYVTPHANSPVAAITSTTFDDRGNLAAYEDGSGRTWRFSYDLSNNLIFAVAPNHATNTFLYDNRGNLVRTIAPDGRWTRAYAYDAAGRLTNVLALVRTERVPITIRPVEPRLVTNLLYEPVAPAPAPALVAAPELPMPDSAEDVDALIASVPTPAAAIACAPEPVSAPLAATSLEITRTTTVNPLQYPQDPR